MKAKIVSLKRLRTGLSISFEIVAPGGRRRVSCRPSFDAYEAAGAPALYDRVDREVYLLLAEKEEWAAAYARAVQILSMGDNSRRALLQKLLARGFEKAAAEAAVVRLTEEGYLNEAAMLDRQFSIYAKKRIGMAKILPSLMQKGFAREAVMAALARAEEKGEYNSSAIKAALLAENASLSPEEMKKLLKKQGFLS